MKKGLVSVVIPYKKDRGFIIDAVESVKNQTYRDVEIIESHGSYTLGVNANNGIKKANGEFIKILADDDLLPPKSIEYLISGIGDADFCTANAYIFKGTDVSRFTVYYGKITNLSEMLSRNTIHGGTVLYRRSGFDKFGYFDEGLVTGEEYDLHLKWISKGAKQSNIDKAVHMYRLWDGSKSQSQTRSLDRVYYINEIKKRYEI